MIDEAERSLHDALCVLSQTVKVTRTVLGGGCSEMFMSCAVEEARVVKGQKALAVEAFGRALRQIPTTLADNARYDSADLVAKLRAVHYEGFKDAGLGRLRVFWLPYIFSQRRLGTFFLFYCFRYGTWCHWVYETARSD